MPPKPVETLNDPNAQPAFRSFWTAQSGPGHAPDPYEYQGAPPAGAAHGHAHHYPIDDGHSHAAGDDGHSHAHAGAGHAHQHGGPHGHPAEDTPLLTTSSSSSSRRSEDGKIFGLFRSYATLCYCLIPLLLLLLLLGYLFYRSRAHSPPPPHLVVGGGGSSTASTIAAVCNPFALTPTPVDLAHHHGLVALLHLLPPHLSAHATSTSYYLTHSISTPNSTFFFSSLDTPTRLFSRAFHAHNLTSGQDVYLPGQYFLLSFHTVLTPPPHLNHSAHYQLGLISDDGASLYTGDLSESDKASDDARLIDNDGVHTSRMATSAAMRLRHPRNVTLHYFQGPPAHIALQLLYKRVREEGVEGEGEGEVEEGKGEEEGNDLYWHVGQEEGQASTPTAKYLQLQQEGWQVVPESWYYLPARYEGKEEVERQLAAGIDPCR